MPGDTNQVIRPVKQAGRAVLRRYSPRLLYPYPNSSLAPERLYAYLDALWQRRELDGAVVEVGCWLGGTAAIASRMLERTGHPHRYVAVDTFGGFVPEQYDHDEALGTPNDYRHTFDGSSRDMVRRLLNHWQAPNVELVQGDIVTVPDEQLPERIVVALIDVDLDIPVYEALRRLYPRLVPGGVALVDDCGDSGWPGANTGYERFVGENGLPERYFVGFGIAEAE